MAGPPLKVARENFGMAVVGQRVYAVGGLGKELEYLDSVEYLEFEDWRKAGSRNPSSELPFTKSWKIDEDLVLDNGRFSHSVVRVGSCLIVVGGDGPDADSRYSVEVLDTKRNLVWELPERGIGLLNQSVVAISKGIAIISCWGSGNAVETLSLVDKNTACFARLMSLGKAPTRPKQYE